MKKVGIYCRLSEEDRDKIDINNDSESIQNQKNMLIKYSIDNDWEIVDIYCDEDFSGAGMHRPDFERLIKDCENGKINIVLCKTQSRFSRDMEVIEKYLHNKFLEWKVRFISIVDNADTDDKGNKKSRQINGLINEWYLEDLSENIRKTLKTKRDNGQFVASFAVYGYKKNPEDKHKLIVDDVAAKVVQTIFRLSKEGNGYSKIVKYLNAQGIPNPAEYKKQNGSNWHSSSKKTTWGIDTIYKILKDQTYTGVLVQGKLQNISYKNKKKMPVPREKWSITPNAHEAIIDIDTWQAVQDRLKERHRVEKRSGELQLFSKKFIVENVGLFFRKIWQKVYPI